MNPKHNKNVRLHPGQAVRGDMQSRHAETLQNLCADLGPVVYFIRTKDGLIKIGYTSDLYMRKRSFRITWDNLLALTPGSEELERSLHERFAEHLARGHEYYRPVPEIIAYVNELREKLGIGLIK